MRALVYIEETVAEYITETGYRATITLEDDAVRRAIIHPLGDRTQRWPLTPGTAAWRAVEAFVAALPSFRSRAGLTDRDIA